MSNFERVPAAKLAPGDWVIIGGWLSRVEEVSGSVVTTDRGHVGDTRVSDRITLSRLLPGADIREAARAVRRNAGAGRVRHLGAAQVAEELGIARSTVTASLRRHGPTSARPFPEPAVYVGDTPGWHPSQLSELREWFGHPVQGRPRRQSPE